MSNSHRSVSSLGDQPILLISLRNNAYHKTQRNDGGTVVTEYQSTQTCYPDILCNKKRSSPLKKISRERRLNYNSFRRLESDVYYIYGIAAHPSF